jgi:DivIVA domain-containing protein
VALGRSDIERTDFSSVRRGYNPAEVDDHLRSVADAMEEALKGASQDKSPSGAASRGVKRILDAAENLAALIETQARKEGERIETEARLEGEKIVERARQQAAAEEKRAQRARERHKRANAEISRLREALAGLQPVVVEEEDEEPTVESPAAETEETPAVAHVQPIRGDGAVEAAQESTADAAHEAAPETVEGEAVEVDGDEAEAGDGEGARLIALNMALTGTPREETAKYLKENFELEDAEEILDDAYSRAG